MTSRMDEDEHSIEMHLPFIKKVHNIYLVTHGVGYYKHWHLDTSEFSKRHFHNIELM